MMSDDIYIYIYINYLYNIISNNYIIIFVYTYQLNCQILVENIYFEHLI